MKIVEGLTGAFSSLDRIDLDSEVLKDAETQLRARMAERGQDVARVEFLLWLIECDPVVRLSLQTICELKPSR